MSFDFNSLSALGCWHYTDHFDSPHPSPPSSVSKSSTASSTGTYDTAFCSQPPSIVAQKGSLDPRLVQPLDDGTLFANERDQLFLDSMLSNSLPQAAEPHTLDPSNFFSSESFEGFPLVALGNLSPFQLTDINDINHDLAQDFGNLDLVTSGVNPRGRETLAGSSALLCEPYSHPAPTIQPLIPSHSLPHFNLSAEPAPLVQHHVSLSPRLNTSGETRFLSYPPLYHEQMEDAGNDGDTESTSYNSESLAFPRRRHAIIQYSGDNLVSLKDIEETPPKRTRRKAAGRSRDESDVLSHRRIPYRLRLCDQVRGEIERLTGMDKGKTVVEVCQALSNNELNAFAVIWRAAQFHHLHPSCCDVANFYIDLVTAPRSPWNQSAARVFTVHFIKKFKLAQSDNMANIVREVFFVRMKTLKAQLKRETGGKEALEACCQASRHWWRKYTLFRDRWDSMAHPALRRYRPMLLHLGVEGMSTDESEQEDSNDRCHNMLKIFRVRVVIWRGFHVNPPLRWMDKVALIVRRMKKTMRGALPRIRIVPDVETERHIREQAYQAMAVMHTHVKFVNDLPKGYYDGTWFNFFLGDGFDLRYTAEEFDFSIDLELVEFVHKHMTLRGGYPTAG